MKRIFLIILVLIIVICEAGCSSQKENSSQNTPQTETSVTVEETVSPVYAKDINDGTYEITVDSSASMFRVVKCELIVKGTQMHAVMTMSGQGYGMVYMGTGEEALADSEDSYIPFVLDENGGKTFTVPVEALNKETDCAAWSIKKEKWYDRTLIFESAGIPVEAFDTGIKDGIYSVEAAVEGGTGRTTIEKATVEIKDGSAAATIVWSSPHYEYMLIGDTRYEPIQKSGNSTFKIPIIFDKKMKVSASTVAMSMPHVIEYTIYFDSSTLKGE